MSFIIIYDFILVLRMMNDNKGIYWWTERSKVQLCLLVIMNSYIANILI